MANLNIIITADLRKRFKTHCIQLGTSMKDRLAVLIEHDIGRKKKSK